LEDRTLLAEDMGHAFVGAVLTRPPLSVVLVSDTVAQAERVRLAAGRDTVAIVYDSNIMTTDRMAEIVGAVSAAHGGAEIGHIGIVTHGGAGRVEIGATDSCADDLIDPVGALGRLRSVLSDDARFDIYACSVASGSAGRAFVDELATRTGAAVFASDDAVGSGDSGDLIWEYSTSQTQVGTELFVVDEIESIVGLSLATPTPTNLTATATGPRSVSLSWDDVIGAGDYFLERSTSSTSGFNQIAIRAESQPNYTDSGTT
jgi:hypothetical protein